MTQYTLDELPTSHDLSLLDERYWRAGQRFNPPEYVVVDGHPYVCLVSHRAAFSSRPGLGTVWTGYWERALWQSSLYIVGSAIYATDDAASPNAVAAGGGGGGGDTGLVVLSSGTITDPVAYFDVALPAGYFHYELRMHALEISQDVSLSFRLSQDGGVTFAEGGSDYLMNYTEWSGNQTPPTQTYQYTDSQGYFSANPLNAGSGKPNYFFMYINPGSAGSKPLVYGRNSYGSANSTPVDEMWGEIIDAMLSVASARQDAIRIGAYFGASGNLIGGQWILLGVPS